jgi:hypothetical protein
MNAIDHQIPPSPDCGEIHQTVLVLQYCCEVLREQMCVLNKRLEPVKLPPPPEEKALSLDTPTSNRSQLGQTLETVVASLKRLENEFIELEGRLAL